MRAATTRIGRVKPPRRGVAFPLKTKEALRALLLLCGSIALGACSPSSDGPSLAELPPEIPAGLLRNAEDWTFLPRPGRDEACAPGTPCARAVENVLAWASRWQDAAIFPDLTESLANDNDHDVVTLACALAWRASDDEAWRERARRLLARAVLAPYVPGGSALRPGRNLLSYVLAASTIDLAALDPLLDRDFRAWIERVAEIDLWQGDGVDSPGTFRDYQEQRPNNLGLIVGAARVAVDMYLGGETHGRHLLEARDVLRRFLGDGGPFVYPAGAFGGSLDDNSWQSVVEPERFVGVNPVGARIPSPSGFDVDGCLPEEMRRLADPDCASCGRVPSFLCYNAADSVDLGSPPGIAATGYPWEALQGLVMQAYLLWRCGYETFVWGDAAIERAHRFLFVTYGLRAQDTWSDPSQSDDATCWDGASDRTQVDDTWVPHVVKALLDPVYLDESSLVYGGRPG